MLLLMVGSTLGCQAGDADAVVGDGLPGDGPAGNDALGPAAVLDAAQISELTLADLGWTEEARVSLSNGVVRISGDFGGGPFTTLDAGGSPRAVTGGLHERAAIYLPPGYPAMPQHLIGLGLVWAKHEVDLVEPGGFELVVATLGVPVLLHGEYAVDWLELGLSARSDLTAGSFPALIHENPCEVHDLAFGNFGLKLAEVNMRALTLLQRISEREGGQVNRVGLRGGSKEGAACWYVSGVDPRLEVASCGGFHLEDLQALREYESSWGCAGPEGDGSGQGDTSGMVITWHWLNATPAGEAVLKLQSVPRFQHLLQPDFMFVTGDVGMLTMHDGKHYPIGSETPFLEQLSLPARYDRIARDVDATPMRQMGLFYLLGDRLIRGEAVEALHPDVLSAAVTVDGTRMRATATVRGEPEIVVFWWNHSADRSYIRTDQPDWQAVPMTAGDGGEQVTPWIDLDAAWLSNSEDLAWYVEASSPFSVGGHTYVRRDTSPVRFAQRAPESSCPDLEIPTWCE